MSNMYETIYELCERRGITPGKLCSEINISRGTLSDLKNGRTKELSIKNLSRIAEYFDVTVDYLYGRTQEQKGSTKAPTLTKSDERDIAKDLETLIKAMDESETLMFDGEPMSDEAKESIAAAMKLGLEAAKIKNKERFTPKKHRKK